MKKISWQYRYVVFRCDLPAANLKNLQITDWNRYIRIKEILPTEEQAEKEVERLNGLQADSETCYFFQHARYYSNGRCIQEVPKVAKPVQASQVAKPTLASEKQMNREVTASVGLRFFGDDLDPEELTRLLGQQPTESWRKGDRSGNKPYEIVQKRGGWRFNLDGSRHQPFEEQINSILDRLTDRLDVWRELSSRYQADFFCGLFIEDCNRGTGLSPEVLTRISERGLRLELDIYSITRATPSQTVNP